MKILILFFFLTCGRNPISKYEKKEPAEDATIYLENEQPEKAIEVLEKALLDDPDNAQLKSILSTAYAQKGGIEPLVLAQKFTGTSSSSSQSALIALFPVLPDASQSNINSLDKAVTLLSEIPSAKLTAADLFKAGIYQTSLMSLRLKKFDTNGDGKLSATELLAMTGTDARSILNNLSAAISILSGGQYGSSAASAEKISEVQSAINASPGATQEEKLRNYVTTHGGS